MKEIVFQKIANAGFPEQTASNAEKSTMEYGLRVGQAIQYEWFRQDKGTCRYFERYNEFHRRRLYARGEQSTSKYKKEMAVNGDLSYLNLDWTNVPILPKFVDIIVNGMADRLLRVKAKAKDALSAKRKEEYQDNIMGQMVSKEPMMTMSDGLGVNMFSMNPNELPENGEELELHMQLNYKPSIEIAQEVAISTLLEQNDYWELKKRFDYDQTVLGIQTGKHMFNHMKGTEIQYVDPATVVWSYTEDMYFKDCFYWGEVKVVPISELYNYDPTLTPEDIKAMDKGGYEWANRYGYQGIYQDSMYYNNTVTLLFFNYKTTRDVNYKIKTTNGGTKKAIEKDDSFNPPEEMMEEQNFTKASKKIEVWYDGIMVMGSNKILKWELLENMARPQSATQMVIPNYIACAPRMYKGNIESLLRRMMPFADLIQLTHLKIQQVISRTVPDGVYLDADGLNSVNLGNGKKYNPTEALKLYFQTGSVVGRSKTRDGEFNHGSMPIQQLTSGSGQSKLATLIANYNHYLDSIRAVTGINEARDASMPDERTLVGVQKMASLNSNTATRHILDSSIFVMKSFAEAMSLRIADILTYADFKEEFANQIGGHRVELLEEIKRLPLHNFGIFIHIAPDEQEREIMEQNIQIALSRDTILLEDAIDIRELDNVQLANQLLKLKRKKKEEKDQQQQIYMQQEQQKAQMAQLQAQQEAETMRAQMEVQSKMKLKEADAMAKITVMREEAGLKQQLMQVEFEMNMQLKMAEAGVMSDIDAQKEEAKDKRIDRANTQQSKLIHQRQTKGMPTSFESNEDSLDGFSFEEFDPR